MNDTQLEERSTVSIFIEKVTDFITLYGADASKEQLDEFLATAMHNAIRVGKNLEDGHHHNGTPLRLMEDAYAFLYHGRYAHCSLEKKFGRNALLSAFFVLVVADIADDTPHDREGIGKLLARLLEHNARYSI